MDGSSLSFKEADVGTKLKFHLCQTRLGWIGMLFSSSGLKATTLPEHSQSGALSQAIKLGGVEEISAEDPLR